MVTFEDIKNSSEINAYIQQADRSLCELGYTEHFYAHVTRCAELSSELLLSLGYGEREAELAKIAAYMHDMGNLVNRENHAQTGALMAFRILDKMGMPPEEAGKVVTAIGYHDESSAFPVNEIAAALIIADKTDVRRSRVRNSATIALDIHDRVNYAVVDGRTAIDAKNKTITLCLTIDTTICSVTEYFEIFLKRMLLCKKAAERLSLTFKLVINNTELL